MESPQSHDLSDDDGLSDIKEEEEEEEYLLEDEFNLEEESERLEGLLQEEEGEEGEKEEGKEEVEDDYDDDDEAEAEEEVEVELDEDSSFQEKAVGFEEEEDEDEEEKTEHGSESKTEVVTEEEEEEQEVTGDHPLGSKPEELSEEDDEEEDVEEGDGEGQEEAEDHPLDSKPEELIEEEEDDDDDDDDDDYTAGGPEGELVIGEEGEGEEGLNAKVGGSAITISDAEAIDRIKEDVVDRSEDIDVNKNQLEVGHFHSSDQSPVRNSETCKDQVRCLDENNEPNYTTLNHDRLLKEDYKNVDHSYTLELTHLKLDDFIPLFKSPISSSSKNTTTTTNLDDGANSIEKSCNSGNNSCLPVMHSSVSLSRSPIAEIDPTMGEQDEESVYPLMVGEDKDNEISGSVIQSNYNHPLPMSYSMDPIIHSPPLSPVLELRSMKNATKSLSKPSKDQSLMKRLSINHHVSDVIIKESNQQHESFSSSLISKSKMMKNEGSSKAKVTAKRSVQPLKKRMSSDNNIVNHGVNIADENSCMIVNHCDGGRINITIEEEAENCNLQLMNIGGRISTESYSPSLRQRVNLNSEDQIRKHSSTHLTSRSTNVGNDGTFGKASKIDRVARFAQLQKIWKKDSFLRGIDGDKRPQAQHSFGRVRSSTNLS